MIPPSTPETLVARCFFWMGFAGLIVSLLFFLLYATGIFPSKTISYESFQILTGSGKVPQADLTDGHGWVIVALSILPTVPIVTLVILSIAWLKSRELLLAIFSFAIAAILILAALGLMGML